MTSREFDAALHTHRPEALKLAKRILRNEDDAEDAVQDASLRVYGQNAIVANFRAYLLAATINLALNMRQRARHTLSLDAMFGDGSPLLDALAYEAPGPEQVLLDRELSETLRLALRALPADQRLLFLAHVEGRPQPDPTRSPQAFAQRLFHVRARLRRLLGK